MVLGHQLGGLAHARAGRQVDDLVFDQLDDGSLAHGGGPIPAMDEQNLSQFAAPRASSPRSPVDSACGRCSRGTRLLLSSNCSRRVDWARSGAAISQIRTHDKVFSHALRRDTRLTPPMSAFGGKADVRELPSECLLIARSGHWPLCLPSSTRKHAAFWFGVCVGMPVLALLRRGFLLSLWQRCNHLRCYIGPP